MSTKDNMKIADDAVFLTAAIEFLSDGLPTESPAHDRIIMWAKQNEKVEGFADLVSRSFARHRRLCAEKEYIEQSLLNYWLVQCLDEEDDAADQGSQHSQVLFVYWAGVFFGMWPDSKSAGDSEALMREVSSAIKKARGEE